MFPNYIRVMPAKLRYFGTNCTGGLRQKAKPGNLI
jgi:hypothetical protein